MAEEKRLHWLMVGTITDKASVEIEEIGGIVYSIEKQLFPPLVVVGLPYPTFEMQEMNEVRIKSGGKSFIWKGWHPGPEWTNAAETNLRSEHDQPLAVFSGDTAEDLGNLDDATF